MLIKSLLILFTFIVFSAAPAFAIDGSAGSCLLYPYFNTGLGFDIFTITNLSPNTEAVRLVFVNRQLCEPKGLVIKLTGNDTFTFLVSALLGNNQAGFMYAYVVDADEKEKHADVLIGQAVVLEQAWAPGDIANYAYNAASFRGIEVNPDGLLHLDGREYDLAPKACHFPRFFGQFPGGAGSFFESRVVLVNLTGGMQFNANCDIFFFNDNEQPFKSETKWGCWDVQTLDSMSGGMTSNAFLLGSAHDLTEPFGLVGVVETGWMTIQGKEAHNPTNGVVIEPACLYAMLIERFGFAGYGADLPFHSEDGNKYINGALWSTDPNGN
jgi:hypothetical protein